MDFSATVFDGDPPSKIIDVLGGGELWQAGRPKAGDLRAAGVSLLVLCAIEWPPRVAPGFYPSSDDAAFPGVDVLVAPNRDDGSPFTISQKQIAHGAADIVAQKAANSARVLVTCLQGLNRSGLVNALALTRLFKISGDAAIERIRFARYGALCNPYFVRYLKSLK